MVCFLWSLVSVSHQLRARNPSTKLPPSCWPALMVPAGTMRPAGRNHSQHSSDGSCAIPRTYWYKGSKAAWGNQLFSDWKWGFTDVSSHLVPQTSQNLVDEGILGPSREVTDVDLLKGVMYLSSCLLNIYAHFTNTNHTNIQIS